MKTNQQLFDEICTHLAKQGVRAGTVDECFYRKAKLRCAVGCQIEDDEYDPEMEGKTVTSLVCGDNPWEFRNFGKRNVPLLRLLQSFHDWAKSSDVLRDIARRLKLSTEVLDTLDFSRWDSQK